MQTVRTSIPLAFAVVRLPGRRVAAPQPAVASATSVIGSFFVVFVSFVIETAVRLSEEVLMTVVGFFRLESAP